jgi:hypothetical protein
MADNQAADKLRRVITGHKNGKSVVLIDSGPAESMIMETAAVHEIWREDSGAMDRSDATDLAAGPVVLEPPAGGLIVRWFVTFPFGKDSTPEQRRAAMDKTFATLGGESSRVNVQAHPGMHLTKTVDIVSVQSGRIKLILEDGETILGPGDIVIQRGTNHAWEVVGDEPVVCLGVLVDRELAG